MLVHIKFKHTIYHTPCYNENVSGIGYKYLVFSLLTASLLTSRPIGLGSLIAGRYACVVWQLNYSVLNHC